ncbi:MAG TPA: hypothetical protein VMS88_05295 [Terriglobales bacterium]|nr:hypothetical protein [Terriglobales bacterium]
MNETRLRNGLLDAEPATAELERKYLESLRGLVERRLTPAQRGVHAFGLLMSLGLTIFFVAQFLRLPGHPRVTVVVGLAIGLLFSVGWGLAALASLRSGRENLRFHTVIRSQLIWIFMALLMGLMLWVGMTSADVVVGIRTILYGLVFFVGFGLPYFVDQVTRQSELRIREDVLRLRLELAQAVAKRGSE